MQENAIQGSAYCSASLCASDYDRQECQVLKGWFSSGSYVDITQKYSTSYQDLNVSQQALWLSSNILTWIAITLINLCNWTDYT